MDENLIKAGTENFSLPHDVVKLPSGGKFYKNKKSSVKVGYLTATDENTIISSAQNNPESLIYNLVRSKVYETGVDPSDLLESDIEAILLFLRNTSFGPEYNVVVEDPITKKPFNTTLILDELNIKSGESEPNEDGSFNTTLPMSNVSVKVRPLFFGELKEIEKMGREYPKGRTAPVINWRLVKQISEIDGDTSKENISKFVDTMPIRDSKYIRDFLNKNVPSLDLEKAIYAPSGEVVTVKVAFGVEFFRPFF